MRWFALSLIALATGSVGLAQFPDRRNHPVTPIIDVIGPLGNRLPPSYRRTYNRPSYLGGKIAYWIAPSSQEAMAWQNAYLAGAYRNHAPRLERHYFFPKPWEALQTGARVPRDPANLEDQDSPTEAVELPPADESAELATVGPSRFGEFPDPRPIVVDQNPTGSGGGGKGGGPISLAAPTTWRDAAGTAMPLPVAPAGDGS